MDGYVIYIPDKQDFLFFRNALRTVMMVSESLMRDYGKWPDTIVFKGEFGKPIYDHFIEKKYNLNAKMEYRESSDNEIELLHEKNVRVKKSAVVKDFGFEYTMERDVQPSVSIILTKMF